MGLVGISGGITVGSAAAAFATLLNFIPRLTQITETRDYIRLYQYTFALGATVFSFIYFSEFSFRISKYIGILVISVMGIFIGTFSSALAEVLNVIPVFAKKFK